MEGLLSTGPTPSSFNSVVLDCVYGKAVCLHLLRVMLLVPVCLGGVCLAISLVCLSIPPFGLVDTQSSKCTTVQLVVKQALIVISAYQASLAEL